MRKQIGEDEAEQNRTFYLVREDGGKSASMKKVESDLNSLIQSKKVQRKSLGSFEKMKSNSTSSSMVKKLNPPCTTESVTSPVPL